MLVRAIYPDSPADKAGVKVGDVILALNGQEIASTGAFEFRVSTAKVGQDMPILLLRDGAPLERNITLSLPPEIPARDLRTLKGSHPFAGVTVANLSPAVSAELGIGIGAPGEGGVVVMKSAVATSGFGAIWQSKDRILAINNQPIASTQQMQALLETRLGGLRCDFRAQRPAPDIADRAALMAKRPDVSPGLLDDLAVPDQKQAAVEGYAPLASRLRPRTLREVIGQPGVLGPEGSLTALLSAGHLPSLILWGPPGCGKTTIANLLAAEIDASFASVSAISSGVADLKAVFEAARMRRGQGRRTLLFVDEIHRFNRAQQDALLGVVEDGTVTLVGATTENPSFALNSALLSRGRVIVLQRLDAKALDEVLARAEQVEGHAIPLTPEAREALLAMADGDARFLLNLAEGLAGHARRQDADPRNAGAMGTEATADLRQNPGRALQSHQRAA